MKREKNLYISLISDENLKRAILEVNQTHRWHPYHKPNRTVLWVESDIPQRIKELRKIINDGFAPSEAKMRRRWDKSAGKWRNVYEPQLWPDQYVHHALMQNLEPAMMRGMDNWCCGSIKNRGIHYGRKGIAKWMQNDVKGTRYCAELDIHHFYDSISPKVVVNRMRQLGKLYAILDSGGKISRDLAAGLLSRLGQLRHCNSKAVYEKFVRPGTQKTLKCVVRKYTREERAKWNISLEPCVATA